MFGYLRPRHEVLTVKEYELYKAIYCGMCRTMRCRVSFFCSFALNYDFILLALLRAEITGETLLVCQKRCPFHPLKRRNCVEISGETLHFVSLVHLALVYEKLLDDLHDKDHSLWKKALFFLYLVPIGLDVRRLQKRSDAFCSILKAISEACHSLSEKEAAGCRDIDEMARVFSTGLENACAVGLDEKNARLMRAAAASAGRLIYLLDACDDLEKDAKSGCYNPFLSVHGDLLTAVEHLEEMDLVLAMYAGELASTVDLITQPHRYASLCDNIVRKGIPQAIERVIQKNQAIYCKERGSHE